MRKLMLSMASVPLLVSGLSVGVSAAESGLSIFDALKFNGEIRPRYEYADIVDNDNDKDAARAFTARTTLGVQAKLLEVEGLSAYIEGSSVNNFGGNNYNSTANGETDYDIIVDPQQARITQAYVDYKLDKTLLRAGRQDVNLDNQRFIGTVDWRQMKQTFDAAAVVDNSFENLTLLGAYVYGFQGVKDLPTTDTKSVLLNAKYKVMDELTLTAYDYMLASISNTYGLAATGNINAGAVKLDYRAEYAVQKDPSLEYQTEDVKADASYYNLDLGANISGIIAGVNYESLGEAEGDATNGFYTPLATLHKFNGWADVFLGSTNAHGLEDANVRLGYTAKGFGNVLAVYHAFTAKEGADAQGDTDLGTEFDIMYANAIPGVKGLNGLVKLAQYKSGDVTGFDYDKTVGWLQVDYKF